MPPKCEIDKTTECEPLACLQRAEAAAHVSQIPHKYHTQEHKLPKTRSVTVMPCSIESAVYNLMIKSRECAARKLGLLE